MENGDLENRISMLEAKVNELEQKITDATAPKSWRHLVGRFGDDETMKQIADEAQKFRDEDRKKAKKSQKKRKQRS